MAQFSSNPFKVIYLFSNKKKYYNLKKKILWCGLVSMDIVMRSHFIAMQIPFGRITT